MSDQNDTASDDLFEESDEDSELVRRLRAELRNTSSALQEERGGRIEIERREAFRTAGVDPTKGPGKLLFDAYDGEADPEAIKTKASEYGLDLSAPQPQQQEAPAEKSYTDQERAGMQMMDEAGSSDSERDRLPTDPAVASREAFDREMAVSGNRREAMAKSFNARMIAALEANKKGARG